GLAASVAALAAFLFLGGPQGTSRAPGATLSERHAVGYQSADKLVLAFNLPRDIQPKTAGNPLLELVRPERKDGDSLRQPVQDSTNRVEFPAPKLSANQLTLRCTLGNGTPMEVPLRRVLLVRAHETTVSAGKEFFAGSTGSLRVGVHGVKS